MFERKAIYDLIEWSTYSDRKPLILRGARQTGKTTIVDIFAKQFDQYLKFNLDKDDEKSLFERGYSINKLVPSLFFFKNKVRKPDSKVLIFIDEIQNSPKAVAMLRYFHEEASDLFVIAAGSLLESLMDKFISFPVGRVEYLKINPCSFDEFLIAMEERVSLDMLSNVPVPEFAHEQLTQLFKIYSFIGGMPEVIQKYSETKDLHALKRVYNSLIVSYLDDVEKYAENKSIGDVVRYVINNSFKYAGERIKFQKFADSDYKSREISTSFAMLEKAMLTHLVLPVVNTSIPMDESKAKTPKLHMLDTGIVNFLSGLQKGMFEVENIDHYYQGKIAEHIVGQELRAMDNSVLNKLNFWVRDKKNSSAEVDYIYQYTHYLIPIEVKSGKTGRLRSLFQFMDACEHKFAVRVYSGNFGINEVATISGKEFYLLNLPFYAVHKLEDYLRWFIDEIDSGRREYFF